MDSELNRFAVTRGKARRKAPLAATFAILVVVFTPLSAYCAGTLPVLAAGAAGAAASPPTDAPPAGQKTDTGKTSDKGPVGEAQEKLNTMGQHALLIASLLIGIGTFAMAIVEMVKGVCLIRMRYHRWSVRKWTAGEARHVLPLKSPAPAAPGDGAQVLAELEILAAGGHDSAEALYDQPIEKVMGQLQAAANVAIEFPLLYPSLYGFLTATNGSGGIHDAAAGDSKAWSSNHGKVAQARSFAAGMPGVPALTDAEAKDAKDASAARTRISNQVSRKLDAFQLETQYLWTRLNQWASIPLGAWLFYLVYPDTFGGPFATGMLCVAAGVLAPFAKDLKSNLASFAK